MPIRHHSSLSTAVAMVRTAVKLSSLVNIRAIRIVAVGEVSINSIKDRSNNINTLNSINKKLSRMHLRVVGEEGAEALSITGHPLSRDVSSTNQHRSHRVLSPKASTSMRSLHTRFQSSR